MSDDPASHTLALLRRMDIKLDRLIDGVQDLRARTTTVEENLAGANRRLDRLETRIERIERRFDLIEAP